MRLGGLCLLVGTTPVRFEGNHALDVPTLSAALSRAGATEASDDAERQALWLLATYYDHGYVDARVVPVRAVDDGKAIVFRIHEGAQYRLGAIEVRGDTLDCMPSLPHSGEVFMRSEFARALERTTDCYHERGYRAVEVKHQTRRDTEQRFHLMFEVIPGPLTPQGRGYR